MKVWAKTKEFSEGKFLVVRRDGTTPDWPHFVMGARDPAVPEALMTYAERADDHEMDADFSQSVRDLAIDFMNYRLNAGDGDPDAPPHRTDLPLAIGLMRHNLEVKDIAKALERIVEMAAENQVDVLPRIHAIANIILMGNKPKAQ